MTTHDLKKLLSYCMRINGHFSKGGNEELLDHLIDNDQIMECSEVSAFQVGETTVFLSDSGVTPKNIVVVDLKNGQTLMRPGFEQV